MRMIEDLELSWADDRVGDSDPSIEAPVPDPSRSMALPMLA